MLAVSIHFQDCFTFAHLVLVAKLVIGCLALLAFTLKCQMRDKRNLQEYLGITELEEVVPSLAYLRWEKRTGASRVLSSGRAPMRNIIHRVYRTEMFKCI